MATSKYIQITEALPIPIASSMPHIHRDIHRQNTILGTRADDQTHRGKGASQHDADQQKADEKLIRVIAPPLPQRS